MPKINANHINLYYEIHGQGDPIVFIGGFSADHTIWEGIIEPCARNHQVIVFDNRGIGQSDCPNYPYTVDMMAEDAVALCRALGISSAHFVGNSMGGSIVQTVAYKYPKLVKSAVISNSFPKPHIKLVILTEANLAMRKENVSQENMTKLVLPTVFSKKFLEKEGMVDALIQIRMKNPYPMSVEGYANQANALLNFNSTSWLKEITQPCLIITADDDFLASVGQSRELAKTISNAEFYCFNDVGHLPHVEQPEVFCKLILGFISKNST